VLLNERFNEAFTRARREGLQAALLMIDLDRFKNINDTLGHDKGDELLKLMANKLTACIRHSDTLARWGGDEFVVLLPGLPDVEMALDIANRCLAAIKQPVMIDEQRLHISGSIGLTMWSSFWAGSEDMLKEADIAMYRAKKRGGDCIVTYAPEMNTGSRSRLTLESALYRAIENDELILHYQPLVSGLTGRICAVEALVRWKHPELGLVPPGDFIPIAEENGFIVPLGKWVLRTACAQMVEWIKAGMDPVTISVNLSGRQFCDDGLLATVKNTLDETGLDPHMLELEITETALMVDVGRSKGTLAELKGIGVHVALDDFGIGYSSLSYLRGLQLDTLKIDRAFTSEVTTNQTNSSIVRATLAMAKGLHLKTVAEGIESLAQARFLVAHGCDTLQGFLFSKPMPAEDLLSFVLASHTYLLSRKISAS
jgi:diguanylate cyclase (GGDEF)-like protein